MSLQIAPLNKEKHANTKIDVEQAFLHIKEEHLVPVSAHEFVRVGAELPVVFLKNEKAGAFEAIAMLSLQQGSNMMVNDGKWLGLYVPRAFRNFPLALMANPNDPADKDNLYICVAEGSPMVNTEKGYALFNEDGSQSEFLQKRSEAMADFLRQMEQTKEFNRTLAELDLLSPQSLTIELDGNKRELTGFYVIDEAKLNELDAEKFALLRSKGMLPPIYAHLMSLQQVQRLGERQRQLNATAAA